MKERVSRWQEVTPETFELFIRVWELDPVNVFMYQNYYTDDGDFVAYRRPRENCYWIFAEENYQTIEEFTKYLKRQSL